MATCPKCKSYFRLPEDEQYGHNCPLCGYGEEEREVDDDDEAVGAATVR